MAERYTIHQGEKQVGFTTDFDTAVNQGRELARKTGRLVVVRDEHYTMVWSAND